MTAKGPARVVYNCGKGPKGEEKMMIMMRHAHGHGKVEEGDDGMMTLRR
jgi:hypothetical protein